MKIGQTTTRRVVFQGKELLYTLESKSVKNLNLRIRRDGTVCVSARPGVPLGRVDAFVLQNAPAILAAQQSFAQQPTPPVHRYTSGECFYIAGERKVLEVQQGEPEGVALWENTLRLTTRHPEEEERRRRLVMDFFRKTCLRVFQERLALLHPQIAPYGVPVPLLRVREMKSRWGSCIPGKGVVTLNTHLLAAPVACLDYVILHELCHFLHPNHSKDFYAQLSQLMPDWKERKALLNQREQPWESGPAGGVP